MLFLSYILDINTPTYGDKNKFEKIKKSNITNGDIANDTSIATTVHIGTHIDLPYHFYENGQTIEEYDIDFFISNKILFLEIEPANLIIENELIEKLNKIKSKDYYEFLIVKTGMCNARNERKFWERNYGFSPKIAIYLREKFNNIRIFGFDSISVASFQERSIGRESHQEFLNPDKPILLLEDMDLRYVNSNTRFKEIIVSPLRIRNCDGLPCSVFGSFYD